MFEKKFMSSKGRNRRKIIIGCSSVVIISVCGTIGLKVINRENYKIGNMIFGGQENISYSDQSTEEVIIDEITLKQIESYLASLGFGYIKDNVEIYYADDYEVSLEKEDSVGKISTPEKLYIWYKDLDINERPEYVSEEDKPVLTEYIELSDVTTDTIKDFYNAWLKSGQSGEPFELVDGKVILYNGEEVSIDYNAVAEGTATKLQIEQFKLFLGMANQWTIKIAEHDSKKPQLTDVMLDENGNVKVDEYNQPLYKYVMPLTTLSAVNIYNIQQYYDAWVQEGRQNSVYASGILYDTMMTEQINLFKQYEQDVADWQAERDLIVMPDILDYVAENEVTESNIEQVYNIWLEQEQPDKTIYVTSADWVGTITKAQSEKFAEYKVQKDLYDKWIEWRDNRNNWLRNQKIQGFFSEREIKGIDSSLDNRYRNYWIKVARKVLGLEEVSEISNEHIKETLQWLTAQIYDKDEQKRNLGNILEKTINDEDLTIYDKDNTKVPSGSGGGSTPGGDSGSSGTGGDSTGGGSTGDSSTGDGTTGDGSAGDGTTGDDTSGETTDTPQEPEDTVLAKFRDVTLTSPSTGIYTDGQKIQIRVSFDKSIYGTKEKGKIDASTAPKLLIKFGEDGKNKEMTFESVNSQNIMYSYIIEEDDNGSISLASGNNFTGVIYNRSGYETKFEKLEASILGSSIQIDNVAPEVKSIECISSSSDSYITGEEIKIKVTFNEAVYTSKNKVPIIADSAPIFIATFGSSGKFKNFVFDSYSEKDKSITYKYVVTSEDKGRLKINVSNVFDGTKEICDEQGNSVKIRKGVVLTGTEIIVNSTAGRIDLDKEEIILDLKNKEENEELIETINASLVGFAEGTIINWSSTSEDVVTVNSNGIVTAKKVGQAVISAIVKENNVVKAEAKCNVTVKDTTKGETKVEIENTTNNKIEIDMNEDNEEILLGKVVITDKNGNVIEETEQKITYISKDENIAKIENGKIIGVNPGKTTIIAKAEDGTEIEFEVIITNSSKTEIQPTGVTMEMATTTIDPSKTKEFVLNYNVEPKNSNKNEKVTFSSSNENVAIVDENGKVTIVGEGTAVITVTTENGKKAYTTINSIDTSKDEILKDAQNGDYNKDESIDSVDMLVLLRHVAASKSPEIAKKHQDWLVLDEKYYLLDVNKDGKVDVSDVLKLQRHIAASKSETIANKHKDWKLN